MDSLWKETAHAPRFHALQRDIKTEVAIVGGGMAGLLCAYMLQKAGVNYALIEAEQICDGATKNTTAKITSQHGLCYHRLVKRFGWEYAHVYLEANQWAVKQYRNLCKKLRCDFEEKNSYVYTTDDREKLEKEYRALERLGYKPKFVSTPPLPFALAGAIRFDRQGQFHPLKFAYSIAEGLSIYEHTKALQLAPHTIVTEHGKITADKIIVATHFPILNKHGMYFLKQFQHRSYVLALKNAPKLSGMYVDDAEKGLSFRNYEDFLLLGGGDHRTGEQGGCWQELEAFAKAYYPNAEIAYRWSAQDCMTLDEAPYIGRYSKRTEDLYVATGFNKWGITSSMVAAKLLTDMVLGKQNEWEKVFSPSRTMLRKQLFINAGKTALNLITPTTPRCPHLGCALKYNAQEHSWDCPCHGSRFTEEGKVIDNPATGDLKKSFHK